MYILITTDRHDLLDGGFEWISINLSNSAAFSLQTSENNLKPPKNQLKRQIKVKQNNGL